MDKAKLVGIMILAALVLGGGSAADMSGAIERVKDSVVTIKADSHMGAGFIVSPDGYVLTSAHVLGRGEQVSLTLANGSELTAEVAKKDDNRDLALLRVDQMNLPAVQFAGSAALKQGAKIAALGAPLGLEGSVTEGVVSAVDREIEGKTYLQIDAALNEGNSGGPVIDERGRVVAVATWVVKQAENVGFAIPSDQTVDFLQEAGLAVSLALGEQPEEVTGEPPAGGKRRTVPLRPPPPTSRPQQIGLGLLIAIPLVLSLVVSLVVSLLVVHSLRRSIQPPVSRLPQQPPPDEEDLSDVDITLH